MSPADLLLAFAVLCIGTPPAYGDRSSDKTVYLVHYRQGRNIIPVTVELDYEQKTGHVLNLNPRTAGKSITFYDFRQRAVAYKYLNSNQCFISRLSEETLYSESKSWKKLEKKVFKESSIETLWASNRTISSKQLYGFAGERIREFCKDATSFLVTSPEHELLKFRRKRETASSQQKGQFSHRSYGHYGHQSHNYAHYGHETYSGRRLTSSGEASQTLEQQQIRREAPPGSVLQPPPSQASIGHFGGSGTGVSEGFALKSGFEGGYQLNHPLGIRAGSQYRGGINTQGQYAADHSGRLPSGAPISVSRVSGLPATRADSSRIPGAAVQSLPSVRGPGAPSITDTSRRPGVPADHLSGRDAQPSVLSPGEIPATDTISRRAHPGYPSHPPSGVGLPSFPSTVTQPGYHSSVTQPGYPSSVTQPGYPSSVTQPGYPSSVTQPGYPPSVTQPGYPSAVTQPGYPISGQPPCCQPKPSVAQPSYPSSVTQPGYPSSVTQPGYPSSVTQPGYPSSVTQPGYLSSVTQSGYPSAVIQPGYPSSVTQPGYPSSVTQPGYPSSVTQPGYPSSVTQPGYPSSVTHPGYPSSVTQRGYPSAVTQPGYPTPEQPPCCQPKTEVSAIFPDRPSVRVRPEVPATPVQPHGYPSPGVIRPGYPLTGIAQPSYPLPEISRPSYLPAGIDQPGYPSSGIGYPSHPSTTLTRPGDPSGIARPGLQVPGQPKIQVPAVSPYPSGVHTVREIGVRPVGTAAPLIPHVYPSLGVAQPSYPEAAGPGYAPSEIPHPGYITPAVTHPGYPGVIIHPGYQAPGLPPCCQPKVRVVSPALSEVPSPRDVRITPEDGRLPVDPRGYPSLGGEQPGYLPSRTPQPGYLLSEIPQPGYLPYGKPQPGFPSSEISQPGFLPSGISQPGYPPSGISHPGFPSAHVDKLGYLPDGISYPGYPPGGHPLPGHPSLGVDQPGYPPRPIDRPGFPPRGIDQPGYLPPGIDRPGYPSHSVLQPIRPPTAIASPGLHPGYTPEIVSPGYPVHTGYPIQPGYQLPGAPGVDTTSSGHLVPRETRNGLVSPGYPAGTYPLRTSDAIPTSQRPGHVQLPAGSRAPGTYPTSPVLPDRVLVPGQPGHPVPGGVSLTPRDQVGHPRDRIVAVRSEGDTAVSQTQVQTGYEGTAAEATSIGRRGGLGAQTQVQGGYTGNGSFSAQAQSGFTGGVTQSQVRGGKQGGSSGSSAQVERVGSAQSQVQVGRPSGAATSSAQGKFLSGVTQVQAQSGRTGGSAGAQSQSMGTSSSQVQVNVADGGAQTENGFQGGVSASVSGSHSGAQAQTQLQGSYDSGRTYVATAQGGFDSTSEFRGAVPIVGSIPEMAARPLNGRLQPPHGHVDGQYLQRPVIGAPGLRPDQISQTPGYQQLKPAEGDAAYQREYRFPNGSVRVLGNGASDQIDVSRRIEGSRRPSGIGTTQFPGNGIVSAPGIPQVVSGRRPTTYPGHLGLDESTRVPSLPHLPGGISHHMEPARRDAQQTFHPTYPQSTVIPGPVPHGELPYGLDVSHPSAQIPHTETRGAIDTTSRTVDVPAFPMRPGHVIPSPGPMRPGHMISSTDSMRPGHVIPSPVSDGFPGQMPSLIQLPGIPPVDSRLPPGSRILRPSEFPGTTAPFDDAHRRHLPGFTRVTQDVPGQLVPGDVPGHVAIPARHDRERVPSVHPDDGVTQIHRTSPPRPEPQPYDHREVRPPQKTVRPLTPQPDHIPGSVQGVNISREVRPRAPSTHPRDPSLPTSRDSTVADCCKPKRDWRTRCCQTLNGKQNGDTYTKPRCCTSKHSDGDDDFNGDSDFDDDVDGKDTCRVVKAVCYLVYKPNGRARVCKPTGTRGC